jgi:hypothetical protein
MKTLSACIALTLLAALAAACHKAEKLSPDELIALLSRAGATVEKNGSFDNKPPAEMDMKLLVDGAEGFTADRFPSTDLARDYCQTQDSTEESCFTVDYWAVRTWARNASGAGWAKLLAAAGKASAVPRTTSTATAMTSTPSMTNNCPTMKVCCSDPSAPPAVLIGCSGWADGKLHQDCDENVAAILRLYADPQLNRARAKPPAGCAK